MYFLYNSLLIFLVFLSAPFWILKVIFSSKWRKGIGQRFGFISIDIKNKVQSGDEYCWIHASSAGEAKIACKLIDGFKKKFPDYRLLISSMTPTGIKILKALYPNEIIIFIPLDLKICIRRILRIFRINLLVLIETELWPNLIRQIKEQNSKVIVLNGRISDKSFGKYKIFKSFMQEVLSGVDIFGMQTETYKERIVALGASKERVRVTGNIKYDEILHNSTDLKSYSDIDAKYNDFGLLKNNLIWVAGSLRAGEETIILDVYTNLLKNHPTLKLIMAPRHLERICYIENLLKKTSFYFVKKSLLNEPPDRYNKLENNKINIILLDTMGELLKAYSIANIVFVGGSLVNIGGHNILEAASLSKPVLFGPYMQNFKESAELLIDNKGAIMVKNGQELEEKISNLLTNPGLASKIGVNAGQTLLSKQGATSNSLMLIAELLT